MISNDFINSTLGVTEAFRLPDRLFSLLMSGDCAELFDAFLAEEHDLSYDWFTDYFQTEHGDRDKLKQDYTPDCVSQALLGITPIGERVADICAGTGGLTIKAWAQKPDSFYYLEEFSDRALPILLFNLAIRNIDAVVWHGDVLTGEQKGCYRVVRGGQYSVIEELDSYTPGEFDSIIMYPPYSLKWTPKEDERWKKFGIAPKQYADLAFLLHGYSLLSETGTLSAILPHGILFRGNKEGEIRKKMIQANIIDSIVGLPENLFLNTGIPVTFIILKKSREAHGIYIADASKEFEKGKKQNVLTPDQIQKIVFASKYQHDIERYGHFASLEELEENDFNLNIPRYVDTSIPEPPIDIVATFHDLMEIEEAIHRTELKVFEQLSNLIGFSPEESEAIQAWGIRLESQRELS